MIERNVYLNKLIESKENGFPKVITGIRRCGKSYLLEEIYKKYLIDSGVNEKNIIIIDLEEEENYEYYDPINLSNHVLDLCDKDKMNYVFIDEIQNVVSIINPVFTDGKHIKAKPKDENAITFAKIVLSLSKKKNIDLYVTGSNSKMLSTDVQTEFRDRATNINVNPLSFEEYMKYTNLEEYRAINEYLTYGGMPLAVLKEREEDKKDYLINLFETTYFKDIIERYKFRKAEALDELCTLLSTCVGTLINSEKLSNTYKSKTKNKIDSETVTSYVNAFKDANIIREANRYDVKGKEIISSLKKYYFIDTGLRNARLNFAFLDEGQMLENVVYNELIYNGYSVSVGTYDKVEKNKNNESIRRTYQIDFLATKGTRMYYIQVASDINNEETRNRELKPYISLNDQIQKIIVINKPINETRDIHGFIVIGIVDFLLRFIK
ncbi:ATP-binding protein [Treponema rectale]|uniref:ATP-binding protein n=1 Tax=Treponema rectale TaxID=744512 RepID=A0A7M1XII7_9SPIR|nr:ATP-binding protein [Treponema rectale]